MNLRQLCITNNKNEIIKYLTSIDKNKNDDKNDNENIEKIIDMLGYIIINNLSNLFEDLIIPILISLNSRRKNKR